MAFAAVETEREASRRLAQLVAASSGKFQGAFETLESAAGKLTSLRRRVQFAESRVCLSAQLNAALMTAREVRGQGERGRGELATLFVVVNTLFACQRHLK